MPALIGNDYCTITFRVAITKNENAVTQPGVGLARKSTFFLNQSISSSFISLQGGVILTSKKKVTKEEKDKRKKYTKPEVKKHENLKKITLLSFTAPG